MFLLIIKNQITFSKWYHIFLISWYYEMMKTNIMMYYIEIILNNKKIE